MYKSCGRHRTNILCFFELLTEDNACRYHVVGHSHFVAHLENHAQYTCLRIAEAFIIELELCNRWVVGLELGYWYATELLQRLALRLNNT